MYFAENFILGRIRKVAIQKHINKTHSQNRRNLNTVKPVHSGHLRLLKRVSAIITCLLYIEFLAFWAKNTAEIKIDVFLRPYE